MTEASNGREGWRQSARFFNLYVQNMLEGYGDHGSAAAVDVLCDLLCSDFELEKDTRELIADAIRRGRKPRVKTVNEHGFEVPFLQFAGFGLRGALNDSEQLRSSWLDAAEYCLSLIDGGENRGLAMMIAGKRLGGKAARTMEDVLDFHRTFELAVKGRDPLLYERASFWVEEEQDPDFPHMLRKCFIEIEAERAQGVDPAAWRVRQIEAETALRRSIAATGAE